VVLTTKLVIAVVALGLAVPLTTTIQKQSSAALAPDPLIGRWNRHVNTEPIDGYRQYLELKSGQRYSFGTVINGRLEEQSFGTWTRSGQTFRFKADAKSKSAMLIEEAELVDGSMLRFSALHGFCKRSHPHEPVREEASIQAAANPAPKIVPATGTERELLAQLRRTSYTSPDGTFVIDADPDNRLIVTINQESSKAKPIEAKVAQYLKRYGITDISARRESNRLWYLYECQD
jgi:hypothetical protein